MSHVTGYSKKKPFFLGESTNYITAYIYADEAAITIKDKDGFDVRIEKMGDELFNATVAAMVAANTWAQSELNPPTP